MCEHIFELIQKLLLMSKRIYAIIIGIFVFFASANAQIAISFEGGSVNAGENIEIDVSVTDYTDIASLQFSINWNPDVLTYVDANNFNSDLPEFSIGNLNFPGTENENLDPGEMTFSWSQSNTEPASIGNGVLFTIVFQASGNDCDETNIEMTNTPLAIQAVNGSYEETPLASSFGVVSINGTDCGGSGGDDVIFNFNNTSIPVGEQVCIPLTVENFVGVVGFQFPVSWDPAVIEFNSTNTPGALTGITFNTASAEQGEILVLWTDAVGEVNNLSDGTTIIEFCFTGVGSSGDMTDLDFTTTTTFESGVYGDGTDLSYVLDKGKVTLTDGSVETLTLIVSEETIEDGNPACVELTANNFNQVSALQAHFTWDASILSYVDVQSLNLPGLTVSNFNVSGNVLSFTWNTPNGTPINYSDNEVMFKICFDEQVDCSTSPSNTKSNVEIVNDSYLLAVIGENTSITPTVDNGSIEVYCDAVPCTILNLNHPDCAGEENGIITVDLLDAPVGCSCVWTKNGVQVASSQTPNCNLVDVGAGEYTIVVTCGTEEYCRATATLVDPSAITVAEVVTPIGCTSSGKIELNVSGGASGYTYTWDNGLPSTASVDISTAGNYCVTVTDANNCEWTKCYDVTSNVTDMTISFTSFPISCNGDTDGSLTASANGGCPSYSYAWSTGANTATIAGLGAGLVSVTITDANGLEATDSFNMLDPEVLSATGTAFANTIPPLDKGGINVVVIGGTEPYSYLWSSGQTTEDLLGVDFGTYSITITDDHGCTTSVEGIVLEAGSQDVFTLGNASIGSDYSGYGVSCFGSCDGQLVFSVTNGTLPVEMTLTNGSSTDTKTISSYGSYSFDNVCAGNGIVISGIDANGTSSSADAVNITAPPRMTISTVVTNSEPELNNGAINVTVTGGVPDYSYSWTPALSDDSNQTNLSSGTYTVIVTDDNGCQVSETAKVTEGVPVGCYESLAAITPNGDGINDQFIVTCSDKYNNTLSVYDRYGKEVYSANNYDNTWDGGELKEGGYMWLMKFTLDNGETITKKGVLTILR